MLLCSGLVILTLSDRDDLWPWSPLGFPALCQMFLFRRSVWNGHGKLIPHGSMIPLEVFWLPEFRVIWLWLMCFDIRRDTFFVSLLVSNICHRPQLILALFWISGQEMLLRFSLPVSQFNHQFHHQITIPVLNMTRTSLLHSVNNFGPCFMSSLIVTTSSFLFFFSMSNIINVNYMPDMVLRRNLCLEQD